MPPPAHLLLRNSANLGAVRIRDSHIAAVAPDLQPEPGERVLDLEGLALLPGLVNGHDHLDLDLLPRLGRPPYRNSYEWLADLERGEAAELQQALGRVDYADRIRWGAYRNLAGGVTTVAHHDPIPVRFLSGGGDLPIRLVSPMAWAHSLRRDRDGVRRAAESRGRMPFIIHLGEGTDLGGELAELDGAGALGPGTVVVHGVSLGEDGPARLAARGAALCWCPGSNHFLLGTTARVDRLPASVPVALGTDSTMTGATSLLDEVRFAASLGQVSGERLVRMVTDEGARALGAPERGRIAVGAPADLMAVPARSDDAATLLAAHPRDLALVIVAGAIRLLSVRWSLPPGLEITSLGEREVAVAVGLGALAERLRRGLPEELSSRLAASMPT